MPSTRASLSVAARCSICADTDGWLTCRAVVVFKIVIGHPKVAAGEQVVPIPVIFKCSGFANQPINDMTVLNLVFILSFELSAACLLFLWAYQISIRLGIYSCLDPFPDKAAVHRIGVVPQPYRRARDRPSPFLFYSHPARRSGSLFNSFSSSAAAFCDRR